VTVTVVPPPVITITASHPNAFEPDPDSGAFTITRSGYPAAELTVMYTVSGTATNGSDHTPLSGSVTFAAGAVSTVIPLIPEDDALVESNETITLTLSGGTNYYVGSPSSATVTIYDDDAANPPVVTVTASDASAFEGGGNPGQFTFSRIGAVTNPLTVNYTISGTATNGTDYSALSGSVTIPAGKSSAPVMVLPEDDATVESDETVVLTISGSSEYSIGSPSEATVTIDDDDVTMVTVQAADPDATEAGPETGQVHRQPDGVHRQRADRDVFDQRHGDQRQRLLGDIRSVQRADHRDAHGRCHRGIRRDGGADALRRLGIHGRLAVQRHRDDS
jgi:hypothetical protein